MHHRTFVRLVVSGLLLSPLSLLPRHDHVRASVLPPVTMVVVAQDVTTATTCTSGWYTMDAAGHISDTVSQPCPLGTVIQFSQVPFATAQTTQLPNVPVNASSTQLRQLADTVRASLPRPAFSSAAITPMTADSCDHGANSHYATTDFSLPSVGSRVHLNQRYAFSYDCLSKLGYEFQISYLGGPTTVKSGPSVIEDGSCATGYCNTVYATDGTGDPSCKPLPYTSTFNGKALSVDRYLASETTLNHYNNSTYTCIGEPADQAYVYW